MHHHTEHVHVELKLQIADIDQWPAGAKLALRMNEIRCQVVDGLTRSKFRICATNSRNAGGIKGTSSSV
jgi:hypothetical protein